MDANKECSHTYKGCSLLRFQQEKKTPGGSIKVYVCDMCGNIINIPDKHIVESNRMISEKSPLLIINKGE